MKGRLGLEEVEVAGSRMGVGRARATAFSESFGMRARAEGFAVSRVAHRRASVGLVKSWGMFDVGTRGSRSGKLHDKSGDDEGARCVRQNGPNRTYTANAWMTALRDMETVELDYTDNRQLCKSSSHSRLLLTL